MNKIKLWHFLLFFILSYIFLFVPTEIIEERFYLVEASYYESEARIKKNLPSYPQGEIVFHIPATKQNYATIFRFSTDGTLLDQKEIPPEKIETPEGKFLGRKKEGYLTHPETGDYFIWYPIIGRSVWVFDRDGNFLWEKTESRYLKASPNGEFLLALSGDHSRFSLINPSWETLFEREGFLFTHFQFSLESTYFCASSFGGDLIWAEVNKKDFLQKTLPYYIKSLYCDFEKKYILLQREKDRKTEIVQYFLNEKETTKILAGFSLSSRPWLMAPLGENNFVIIKEKEGFFDQGEIVLIKENNQLKKILFPVEIPLKESRILVFPQGALFYTKSFFVSLDKQGVTGIYKRNEIANLQKRQNFIYVADKRGFSVFLGP